VSWWKSPARHALAAKGIPTGRFQSAQLRKVQAGNRVGGAFGKATGYDYLVKSLGKKYSEGDEIVGDDYERAIEPIFNTLAESDILADRGDLEGAVAKLELAAHEYASLCHHFNVVRDEDSKEYLTATRLISDKTIARARAGAFPPPKAPEKPVDTISQPNVDDKFRGYHDSD
jgi:hypothetical protein